MSRRSQITLSDEEVAAFLDDERVVTVATLGRDGWPHLMPLWYTVRDGTIWAWTYAKSQKVRNLERDPRCTLQVEAGRDRYDQLRGIMIRAEAVLHRELDVVAGVGAELSARYAGTGVDPETYMESVRAQAPKRVARQFAVRDVASWDHRKLS